LLFFFLSSKLNRRDHHTPLYTRFAEVSLTTSFESLEEDLEGSFFLPSLLVTQTGLHITCCPQGVVFRTGVHSGQFFFEKY
jgi:hypothetical protein